MLDKSLFCVCCSVIVTGKNAKDDLCKLCEQISFNPVKSGMSKDMPLFFNLTCT